MNATANIRVRHVRNNDVINQTTRSPVHLHSIQCMLAVLHDNFVLAMLVLILLKLCEGILVVFFVSPGKKLSCRRGHGFSCCSSHATVLEAVNLTVIRTVDINRDPTGPKRLLDELGWKGLPALPHPLQTQCLAGSTHVASGRVRLRASRHPLIVLALVCCFKRLVPTDISGLKMSGKPSWNDAHIGVGLSVDKVPDAIRYVALVHVPH